MGIHAQWLRPQLSSSLWLAVNRWPQIASFAAMQRTADAANSEIRPRQDSLVKNSSTDRRQTDSLNTVPNTSDATIQ